MDFLYGENIKLNGTLLFLKKNIIIMDNTTPANYERLAQMSVPLYCPTEDSDGNLFCVSTNGDVF